LRFDLPCPICLSWSKHSFSLVKHTNYHERLKNSCHISCSRYTA
jgi:hypothetical protein